MKLKVLIVFCICFVQICFGLVKREITDERKTVLRKRFHDRGASERFIDDALIIMEKYEGHRFLTDIIPYGFLELLDGIQKGVKTSKIDVNTVQHYHSRLELPENKTVEDVHMFISNLKVFQLILLKQLPPKIANGMTNLMRVLAYPNTTTEEIESALNYLYGDEIADIKDILRNVPAPNANDCPKNMQRYSAMQNRLKSMTEIKPGVLQDLATIIEKFPCNNEIPDFLEDFVEIIHQLQMAAKTSKVTACITKENSINFNVFRYEKKYGGSTYISHITVDTIESTLSGIELILSTRLMDETFRPIINFEKAAVLETPIDKIQKALEYVFVDVPVTDCSTEHKN